MIGRLLCSLGLHKRWWHTAAEVYDGTMYVADFSGCKRPGCSEPTRLVNTEERRIR